jgi:hypothetical protein
MLKTEEKLVEEMCWQIHDWEFDRPTESEKWGAIAPYTRVCQVLSANLFSAKSTLPKGSPRRVFIQDLVASLNRKRILPSEKVDNSQS